MGYRTYGRGKVAAAFGLLGATAFGFWLGRGPQAALAVPPPANPPVANAPGSPPSDYSQRVVAYIYGSIPITREDLGEYLIARHGLESVELLVNKKIIELACAKRNITVTDAEIDASILADCATIQVKKEEFIANVIKKNFGKTLYEWKEDVVKPRLLLTKLVKDQITVADDDLKKAFDATFGEKRDCRIIIWPQTEGRVATQEYEGIRKDEQGFDRKARTQANPALAAVGGRIKPIGHSSGVHPEVERAAFNLQPGELSSVITTNEGFVVIKMDHVLPPDASVKFEAQKEALRKEVFDKKVAAAIPTVFKSMKDEAKPVFILKRPNDPTRQDEEARQELKQAGMLQPEPGKKR
jgi:hypothetical protein